MFFAEGLTRLGLFAGDDGDDPDAEAAKQILAKWVLTHLDWLEAQRK